MTDHDWEGDEVKDGSAGVHGGPESARPVTGASPSQLANVVPFPGNWFGSIDELIPVHPEPLEPRRVVLEAVPPAADEVPRAGDEVPPAADIASGAAADASDFWEGEAATLEEVPAPTEARTSIALLRSPDATRRKGAVEPGTAPPEASAAGRHVQRPRVAWLPVLVPAAVVAAAVAVFLAGNAGLGAGTIHHRGDTAALTQHHAPPVVTQTQTVSTRLTVTTTVPERHASTRSRTHKSSGSSVKRASGSSLKAGSATGADGGATHTEDVSASRSTPPATPTQAVDTAANNSGCAAMSPDSGCRP